MGSALLAFCSTPVQAKTAEECIRRVVWAEARGESQLGQQAVAHVILNRARQSGKPVCAVVSEKGQFRQGNPPSNFRVSTEGPDPTRGATFFQRRDLKRWLGNRRYIRIGKHTFYGR